MKILSIAIPCYNSAAYMHTCIESLLVDEESIEIIIVNDGSTKDNTAEIADKYAAKYPKTIKVVHKENGGHGSGVNAGIAHATGKYFKVVDSDDRLDEENLKKILEFLKTSEVDMVLTNFMYDKQGVKEEKKMIMDYRGTLPRGRVFTWEDVKKFDVDQYLMMHSIIYRTEVLRECELALPHHTFYVDNIYVYAPLPYIKTMYYFDMTLYYYFIGRDDQSVNENVMISRVDQQIRVNKILFSQYDLTLIDNRRLRSYMYHHLIIVTAVSSILLLKEGSAKNVKKYRALWRSFKRKNPVMYQKMKYFSIIGRTLHMPGKLGRKTVVKVYQMLQKHMGFN